MKQTRRTTRKSAFLTPPTKDEVNSFAVTGLNGPTLKHLNFDVTGFSMRSMWNKECASILAEVYVASRGALSTDLDKVTEKILEHIPALVKQYARLNPSNDPQVRADVEAADLANIRAGRRRYVSLSC